MIHRYKALVMALVAVSALSAMFASAASADKFKAESAPVTYTGNQEEANVLTTTVGTWKCTTTTFKGTVNVTETSEVSVAPTYGGCTAFGFPAHIDCQRLHLSLQNRCSDNGHDGHRLPSRSRNNNYSNNLGSEPNTKVHHAYSGPSQPWHRDVLKFRSWHDTRNSGGD
jgi:hypothetical protein